MCWQTPCIPGPGDSRARGFLLGGTAGRTTLAGEGLQHQDGNSQLFAMAYPNCVAYDPAFAYEIAVIIEDGIRRMYVDQESMFYYLTVMNEQYVMPPMPEGSQEGVFVEYTNPEDAFRQHELQPTPHRIIQWRHLPVPRHCVEQRRPGPWHQPEFHYCPKPADDRNAACELVQSRRLNQRSYSPSKSSRAH